jgi:heavy metal sensor kinase
MNTSSLRVRVTGWYVGLLATALIAFGAAVYFGLQSYLETSLQRSLRGQAESIIRNFVSQVESKGTPWLVVEVIESYAPESSGRFIRISQQDGPLLYESGDSRDPYIDASRVSHPRDVSPAGSFRDEMLDGVHPLVIYAMPYRSPSGKNYLVEVGASRSAITRVLHSLSVALFLLAPVILVAAALGGYVLMDRPLRPVVELTEQAERIGTSEPGGRLPIIATGDELERLSHSLNRMISRLQEALAHNRRFSADVSHELRTPLTILRGELEHVIQLPDLSFAVMDAVGSSLEEIERMSKIVESLLAISRLDSGADGMVRTPVDLCALSSSTVDQMKLLADEKQVSLHCLTSEPVFVLGDESRLTQVLVNLLDNALKYTGTGGEVTVSATSSIKHANLEVSDNGIGIPGASLPYVFDRFYRADRARSRASGGAGLGLSIVKAICTAHDGSVSVQSVEGSSTTVRVQLPLIAPPEVPVLSQRSS